MAEVKFYEVYIKRKNQDHLLVEMSEDFSKLNKLWEVLHNEWKESVKEERPFVIKKPIVTAFAPGLIDEISLAPVTGQQQQQNPDNPYESAMRRDGFGKTLALIPTIS